MSDSNARREALRTAGMVAGGALIAGSVLGKTAFAAPDMAMNNANSRMMQEVTAGVAAFGSLLKPRNDADILNFALVLEYLEADFYTRAVQANTMRPYMTGRVPSLAQKLRDDENAHVLAIQQRITDLGGTPVAKTMFQFPAETFISQVAFLDFSATLEQTGVHAYLGAAPLLKRRDVLRFAASIYGIEARHTSMIRFASGRLAAPSALESPLPLLEIAKRVAPLMLTSAAPGMASDMAPAATSAMPSM